MNIARYLGRRGSYRDIGCCRERLETILAGEQVLPKPRHNLTQLFMPCSAKACTRYKGCYKCAFTSFL